MRVKIGDQWFEAEPDRPIMVELTEEDKKNIAATIGTDKTKYIAYYVGGFEQLINMLGWMRDGADFPLSKELSFHVNMPLPQNIGDGWVHSEIKEIPNEG